MTSNDKFSFNAVRGPSKFDLMLSLFDGNNEPRRTVEFQLEGARAPIVVAVTMVQQEDGSGESWNFTGWLSGYQRSFDIRGYYSSNSRKGYITFLVPSHFQWMPKSDGNDEDRFLKIEKPEDRQALESFLDQLRIPSNHVHTTHLG